MVKYPGGDPAAKGILARLDSSLRPAREERLRVVREDLEITLAPAPWPHGNSPSPPLAAVQAIYTIENPTDEEIEVDFGFPVLRGIYTHPFSMVPRPAAHAHLNGKSLPVSIISNSTIYGIIRSQARQTIDKAITADTKLAALVAAVRATRPTGPHEGTHVTKTTGSVTAAAATIPPSQEAVDFAADAPTAARDEHAAAREALAGYLRDSLHWESSDVALMLEYASLDFGAAPSVTMPGFFASGPGSELIRANLGPLAAMGEQKATQFFTRVAARFDPQVASTYESVFTAWGGDVRERSLDLTSGTVRPREISVEAAANPEHASYWPVDDPTIYARLDYLDSNAKLSKPERASCEAILKHLPVIFTFAPMNLLHYRATFPPQATQTLTVSYNQFAYKDTAEPSSYQLAYVVHPASFWKEFGPINLKVAVPDNVPFRASAQCEHCGTEERPLPHGLGGSGGSRATRYALYKATLKDKTGEMFVAIGADAWERLFARSAQGPEEDPGRKP